MITLFPTYMLGELRLTSYPYAVEFGGDHGAPETVTELVQSLLADGDIVRATRQGNREISLVVHVEGASLAELAANEAALRRECSKLRNLLTFEPGDPLGSPASVFEVHVAEMRHPRDDEMEQHLLRRWELTLTCAPFARSAEATTVEALPAGSATVPVDTCDSATGWDGTRNGFPYAASAAWEAGAVAVAELEDAFTSPETWTLTRTGSIDVSVTGFLVAQVRTISSDVGDPMNVTAYAGGSTSSPELPVLSSRRIPGSVYFEVVYDATGFGVLSAVTFRHVSTPGQIWQGLFVRSLERTDVSPNITARQQSRIVEVGGTERTPASIHVQTPDGTGSLSQVIVHTSPEDGSGYSPPLRRWRNDALSTGPVTTSAGRLSGFYEPLVTATGGFVAEVPTSALPSGGYILMGLIGVANVAGGSPQIYWSTSTIFPDSTTQQGYANGSVVYDFPDDGWHLVPLAALSLPSVRTSSGKVQIVLQVLSHPDAVYLDEAWLFRADDDCALTIVNTERPQLWLDSAGPSSPVPTVWIGDDTSNRVHPGEGLLSMGHHVLSPDGTAVFTAAPVDSPVTDATFYRRWHSNAAE